MPHATILPAMRLNNVRKVWGSYMEDTIDFNGRELPASPCKGSWDFHLLADMVEDAASNYRGAKRDEVLARLEDDAESKFCGSCPVKYECYQLAVDAEYTGIAGGVALIDGRDHRDKEEKVA